MPASSDDRLGMLPKEQLPAATARDAPAMPESESVFLTRLLETLPHPVSYVDAI